MIHIRSWISPSGLSRCPVSSSVEEIPARCTFSQGWDAPWSGWNTQKTQAVTLHTPLAQLARSRKEEANDALRTRQRVCCSSEDRRSLWSHHSFTCADQRHTQQKTITAVNEALYSIPLISHNSSACLHWNTACGVNINEDLSWKKGFFLLFWNSLMWRTWTVTTSRCLLMVFII